MRWALACAVLGHAVQATLAPCNDCGYACNAQCECGRCNEKPGCSSEAQCLGPCNAGHNA
eukprot:gene7892-7314_t